MALVFLLSSQADEKRVMWAITVGEWDGLAGKGGERGERQGSLTLPEARLPCSPWQQDRQVELAWAKMSVCVSAHVCAHDP